MQGYPNPHTVPFPPTPEGTERGALIVAEEGMGGRPVVLQRVAETLQLLADGLKVGVDAGMEVTMHLFSTLFGG